MPVIALDFTPALKQSAGIGRFVRGLVGGLSRVPSEFSFLLVATRDCPPFNPATYGPGFREARLPFKERTFLAAWFWLGLPVPLDRLVPGFDLFHGLNFVLPPLARAVGVVTVHDLNFMVDPRWVPGRLGRFLRRAVPASVRRAGLVVADSRATAADIVRFLKVDPNVIRVVYGGVDPPETPDPAAENLLEAFGLEPGYILFIGRVEPRKNLPGLIAAYNLLRQKYPAITRPLVIVGAPGWLYDDFLAALGASPFRGDIRWLRGLSDSQVAALLSRAGVLVYPSFYEGFGLPVLEAMAAGVPVVTSNRASLPEVAGDAAWLVDPEDPAAIADAVREALTDEAARARAVAAGRERAAKFTWEAAAETLLGVYREVLGGRG